MTTALITGVSGQDGYYLSRLLLENGYTVHGVARSSTNLPVELRDRLATFTPMDLRTPAPLADVVRQLKPDEIYHLAAHHFSSEGDENIAGELDPFMSVNFAAAETVLNVLRYELRQAKFFYAASAHVFGDPEKFPQTERTPMRPDTPYAISKTAGVHLCHYYRKRHGIFAVAGILYNHESPRRSSSYITTQVAEAAAKASLGQAVSLEIRDLDAVVDWGAAEDYVAAMWLSLQQHDPDTYIIASGIVRTVRDLVTHAFDAVGLEADGYVVSSRTESGSEARTPYIGDASKIRMSCSWEPTLSFRELVRSMVEAQHERLRETTKR